MKSLFFFLPLLLLNLVTPQVLIASDDCQEPTGLKVEILTTGEVKLLWNSVENAKGYKLEVEDANDNPHDFEIETTASHNYYVVTDLKANSSYKFKLRTICKEDKSDWTEDFYFSTKTSDNHSEDYNNNGACDLPTGLAISNISGNSATVSWDPVGAAVNYEVEVEDGENTPVFQFNQVTNETSVTVSGLTPGGQYKAKVKSKCSNDNSDYTQWVFFIAEQGPVGSDSTAVDTTGNASCAVPAGLIVTAITDSSAVVSWDQPKGISIFEVEAEEASDSTPDYVFKLLTNQSAVSLIGLSNGGAYKVKVKSKCGDDNSAYTAWGFFTTGGQPSSADTTGAFCAIPLNLQVSEIGTDNVRISWDAVPGVSNYELEVEDDENTPAFEFNTITTDTSLLVTGLSPNGQYQVKVKSKCPNGFNSEYSAWVFFNTGSEEIRTPVVPKRESGILRQFEQIKVFPNPAAHEFQIDLPEKNELVEANLRLFDQHGLLVWRKENIGVEEFPVRVPVHTLQNGLYHLSIQTKLGTESRKLMIAH